MFKSYQDLLENIKKNPEVLDALDGLSHLTPHMHSIAEDYLIEYLGFKRPSQSYEKVQLIWEQQHEYELVQYHLRIAPKSKSSFRTSK